MQESKIVNIPLSRLFVSDDNVRAEPSGPENLASLKSSIVANGLLTALTVRPEQNDYSIIAGRRRFLALAILASDGRIPKDCLVPCIVREDLDGHADARAASLAENIERLPMHPVEQYREFARLLDDGKTVGQLAAMFAVNVRYIRQRQALARLAPEVQDAWLAGKISAEVAEAFASTQDMDAQRRVLMQGGDYLTPYIVRVRVRAYAMTETDAAFRLIGAAAYVAAGGELSADLFTDDDDAPATIANPGLVVRLVNELLERKRAELLADGWGFVVRVDRYSSDIDRDDELEQIAPAYESADEEAARDNLESELHDMAADDPARPDIARRLDAIDTAALLRAVGDRRAEYGCTLDFNESGIVVAEGVRFEAADVPAANAGADDESDSPADATEQPADPGQPEPAEKDPFAYPNRSAAEKIECMATDLFARAASSSFDFALRAATLALLQSRLHRTSGASTIAAGTWGAAFESFVLTDSDALADPSCDLAGKVAGMTMADVRELFAALVGSAMDCRGFRWRGAGDLATLAHAGRGGSSMLRHAAAAFDAGEYFAAMSKDTAIAAARQMDPTAAVNGSKASLAAQAAAMARRHKWLPPQLIPLAIPPAENPEGK